MKKYAHSGIKIRNNTYKDKLYYRNYEMKSKAEMQYAMYLDALKSAGKIERWDYEPEKLNLAKGCNYTPDFRVIIPNCKITFVEVKGFKREAGRIKFRSASTIHPMYNFIMVGYDNSGLILKESIVHPEDQDKVKVLYA